jgi:peptidyl-prolyl cis-trans isomerase D
MLGLMRRCSQNILVRILLFLLAMAFVVWGVGDVLRGGNKQTVATVAGSEISYAQYYQALEQYVAQLREAYGNGFTVEQMQQVGLDREILERIINNQLIKHRMQHLRIGVGDDIIQDIVVSNPSFFDGSGQFDPALLSRVLQQNGINEVRYVELLREEQSIRLFMDALTNTPPVPSFEVEPLVSHRYEQRVADILVLSPEGTEEPAEPTETELLQFYNDHSNKFMVPELRTVSYIKFGPDTMKDIPAATDVEVKAAYEARKSDFMIEPKRVLEQYLFDDESEARAAHGELVAHKEVKGKIALGAVTKDAVPTVEAQEIVFALEKGGMSEPVKSPLGWHIFIVADITPGSLKPLEEVKDQVIWDLKMTRQSDAYFQMMDEIDKELSSGVELEEVAKKFDVSIKTVTEVDAQGLNAKGEAVKDIPSPLSFLPFIFKLEPSVVTPFTHSNYTEQNAGAEKISPFYMSVRLDKVIPARTKALDEAKGFATLLWKENEKIKALKEFSEMVANEIQAGKLTLDEAGHKNGVKLYTAKILGRFNNPLLNEQKKQTYPQDLIQQLFTLKPNEVTKAYMLEDGSYIIAQLKNIIKANTEKAAVGATAIREELQSNFMDEILTQYTHYLKALYPVERNEALLKVKAVADVQ